jgi:hypothetical protein
VSLREYSDSFTVDSPVTLSKGATTPGTTNKGIAYTQTVYEATLPNSDIYMVAVGNYPFALVVADNDNGLEGFRDAVHGTVLTQKVVTVSGQPALAAVISAKDPDNDREIRFGVLLTFRGNTNYIFAFASYLDVTTTDTDAMKQFFTSARIN